MISWEQYIKEGTVKPTTPNKGKIKSLISMSKKRIEVISSLKLNQDSSSVLFTNYYDSLREICEAITLLKGYKIYNHEATGLFLKVILNEDSIFAKFDKFRLMRNGVNYYGKPIPFEEAKKGIEEIKGIIQKLMNGYLKELE